MRNQNRTVMGKKGFLLWLVALLATSLACSLVGGRSAAPSTPVASSSAPDQGAPIPLAGSPITPGSGVPSGQTGATQALSDSFPLPPDTTIDPESVSEPDPSRGSFELRSTAALDGLLDFYEATLSAQGWTHRYTDANTIGGVTQFWNKGNLYLSLQFGYDSVGAAVRIKYQSAAAEALGALPADLAIPDRAELTNSRNTTWDFFVDQDYAAVMAFYTQASAGWAPCSGVSAGEGEGDEGGPMFPPGATPMPTPTRDSRPAKELCGVLPSQNQVELYIVPHGEATLLHVYITSLNPSDSGLPAEIAIYPGAAIQSADPGMVTFQAGGGSDAVEGFYEEKLTAAGWTPEGQPMESEGVVMMNWKKGNESVMIVITALGANDCLVMIAYEGS
jgi:hypothetical protein